MNSTIPLYLVAILKHVDFGNSYSREMWVVITDHLVKDCPKEKKASFSKQKRFHSSSNAKEFKKAMMAT